GWIAAQEHHAPLFNAMMILVAWVVGATWLFMHLLVFFGVKRNRLPLAISLAGLCVAASVNALYSLQSMYWFSASLRYTFPLAIFTLYLALMIAAVKRPRSNAQVALSALSGAAICFFSAGFAEIHLVFQLAFLSLLLAILFVFKVGQLRWKLLAVFGAGWLGTLASLALQWTAPGVAVRMAVKFQYEWFEPVRHLPDLAGITLDYMYQFVLQPEIIVSFMLLFAVGMVLSLSNKVAALPVKNAGWPKLDAEGKLPYVAGLLVQLVFLPFIWTHSSNDKDFFGRFSLAFMSVVVMNIMFIAGFLLLTWRYRQAKVFLQKEPGRLRAFVLFILFCAIVMLAVPKLRLMHKTAEYFLLFTALSFLVTAWWEWTSALTDPVNKRLSFLAVGTTVGALLIFAAIIAVGQFFVGQLELRNLSSASSLLVLQGLVWGFVISRSGGQRSDAWRIGLQVLCAATIVAVYASIVIGQIRLIPNYRTFAREWDERHALLLDLKSTGQKHVEVPSAAFDLDTFLLLREIVADNGYRGPDEMGQRALGYYGLESITLAEGG
ncbi:MAG: hypothetical protein OXG78_10220, partial [Chloroflexi bacterium]|nr:hypothetical protein [Chloroflexota bacterium]